MHVKPCAGGDDVVINDSQTAEVHIAGIVIASEGKGVITVKPAGYRCGRAGLPGVTDTWRKTPCQAVVVGFDIIVRHIFKFFAPGPAGGKRKTGSE